MGSEHAVGYHYLRELAKKHPILLITEDNEFRPALEHEIARWNSAGAKVVTHYVRHGVRSDGRRNNLRVLYYLTYTYYQWRVYRLAKRLCSEVPVALIHHLTIVGFREPGFCWLLPRPFIWGPVGGLVYAPMRLFSCLSPRMAVNQAIRNVVTALQFWISPRVRLAYYASQRRGGRFLAATDEIGRRFTRRFGGTYKRLPETGASDGSGVSSERSGPGEKLRLLWVGALIDIKPLGVLIEAIAGMGAAGELVELDVVGDGESADRYRAQAARRGVAARFHGWVPYSQVRGLYDGHDLFVLLSLKDLNTNVVFEALTASLPVMCLDHHGYSELIDDTCGYKIPIASKDEVTRRITEVLSRLVRNRSELVARQQAASVRARQFTWEANGCALNEVYESALGRE